MFWIIEQSIRQLRCCPLFFTLFQYLNGFIQEWQSWRSTSKPFRYSNGRVCWTRSLGRRWFRNKQDVMRYWTKVSFHRFVACVLCISKWNPPMTMFDVQQSRFWQRNLRSWCCAHIGQWWFQDKNEVTKYWTKYTSPHSVTIFIEVHFIHYHSSPCSSFQYLNLHIRGKIWRSTELFWQGNWCLRWTHFWGWYFLVGQSMMLRNIERSILPPRFDALQSSHEFSIPIY